MENITKEELRKDLKKISADLLDNLVGLVFIIAAWVIFISVPCFLKLLKSFQKIPKNVTMKTFCFSAILTLLGTFWMMFYLIMFMKGRYTVEPLSVILTVLASTALLLLSTGITGLKNYKP